MSCRIPLTVCALVLCGTGTACNRNQDQITQYEVPKEAAVYEENHVGKGGPAQAALDTEVDVRPLKKQRMLAAIVVTPSKFWFFKIQGKNADVNAVTRDFAAFIATVDFQRGKPTWILPKDWKQVPDDDRRNAPRSRFDSGRTATILVDPKDDTLELAVSFLPNRAQDKSETEQFLLLNINRWRGQMGLRERTLDNLYDKPNDGNAEAVDEVVAHTMKGRKVVFAQFVGTPKPRRPGMGPFMGR